MLTDALYSDSSLRNTKLHKKGKHQRKSACQTAKCVELTESVIRVFRSRTKSVCCSLLPLQNEVPAVLFCKLFGSLWKLKFDPLSPGEGEGT